MTEQQLNEEFVNYCRKYKIHFDKPVDAVRVERIWLRRRLRAAIVQAKELMLCDAAKVCEKYHVQNCDVCHRIECEDNTNPLKTKLRILEAELRSRKIIQIAVNKYYKYALCSDGTMWVLESSKDGRWERVVSIPSDG